MQLLQGRNIALGVCASVSLYKSLEILSLFKKLGANVRVVVTQEAKKLISPLIFEATSGCCVLTDEHQSWERDANNPISLARWAHVLLIAPATANTINKMACGIVDNILLHTVLAFSGKIIIAPAANTVMFESHITQQSLQKLRDLGMHIIPTACKVLACGEHGNGALADVEEIVWQSAQVLLNDTFWHKRKVCISGGGSIEKIDDVRYISNFSSGKMAQSLALALYLKGADVTFIHSHIPNVFDALPFHALPHGISCQIVQSAHDFYRSIEDWIERNTFLSKPYLFMVAAISDYRPKMHTKGKIKKDTIGEEWNIPCIKNADILTTLRRDAVCTIGFKLEDTQNAIEIAKDSLRKKKLDAICLNHLHSNPFGNATNEIDFITETRCIHLKTASKIEQSFLILEHAKQLHAY